MTYNFHRCKLVAEFDVESIASDCSKHLIRSTSELEPDPDGKGFKPDWTVLLFQIEPQVFWHFLIKGGPSYGQQNTEKLYTMTVIANNHLRASADAEMLRKKYTEATDGPCFFLVSDIKDLDSAVLRPGRQRFFREFIEIEWSRAQKLAKELNVELSEKRSYTLAELFHFKDTQNTERLDDSKPTIGFQTDKKAD